MYRRLGPNLSVIRYFQEIIVIEIDVRHKHECAIRVLVFVYGANRFISIFSCNKGWDILTAKNDFMVCGTSGTPLK